MSPPDSGNQERIEEFLRKSLLGEEVVNTQFHLFSAKSVLSGRLIRPRILCANNVLLARGSKYFLDLLSSDANPSDDSLSDLGDAGGVPSYVRVDDYGYESDSDLDEDEDLAPIAETEASKDEPATTSTDPPQISVVTQSKDGEEPPEDDADSVSSDMFVMSPEHPRTDDLFDRFDIGSAILSGGTAVGESPSDKSSASQAAARLRSLASRHILIKDTAFRTWYTLLNYLYTGKINFSPLSSAAPEGQRRRSSAGSLDEPRCSAKSMYRLACKVGLDHLRDEALAYILGNLTEHNILNELSCRIVSNHPQLLAMELDVLYAHIGSAPVMTDFPVLARCIANKELPHGAEIVVGIHARILNELPPLPMTPTSSIPPSPSASACPIPPLWPETEPAPGCDVPPIQEGLFIKEFAGPSEGTDPDLINECNSESSSKLGRKKGKFAGGRKKKK